MQKKRKSKKRKETIHSESSFRYIFFIFFFLFFPSFFLSFSFVAFFARFVGRNQFSSSKPASFLNDFLTFFFAFFFLLSTVESWFKGLTSCFPGRVDNQKWLELLGKKKSWGVVILIHASTGKTYHIFFNSFILPHIEGLGLHSRDEVHCWPLILLVHTAVRR